MPIDKPSDQGTEKDGSLSDQYCKYCYKDGSFTDPEMSLNKMKTICVQEMQKQGLPAVLIEQTLAMLPTLKRWQPSSTDQH
jgi:hypothetical protein